MTAPFGSTDLTRALEDRALVVDGNEGAERVAFELLDAQGNTLAFHVDGQDNGFQFVAFLEAANGFFAGFGP